MELKIENKLVKPEQAPAFRIVGFVLRLIFGSVFVFSGFVKAIDPLGFSYKMQDYMHAMGFLQFDNLMLVSAILLIAFEFTIGLSLISGIKIKFFAWSAVLFMLVMTPLTLWLAVANPVTDCGCFGDALHITNWETFWKNVVLLILIFSILYCEKYNRPYLSPLPSWLISISFFVFSVCISLYCLAHLPLIDFRPYKIGNNIPQQMTLPLDAKKDIIKTIFIYKNKNSGEKKTFEKLNDAPWNDTVNWEYITQHTKIIQKGEEPKIKDFVIESFEHGDITEEILSDTNFVFLFIMYDLAKCNTNTLKELNSLYNKLNDNGLRVLSLTSTHYSDIEIFKEKNNIEYEIATCDPIPLKTAIRANPGVMVLKSGTVIDKWNAADTKKRFYKFEKKYF